LKGESAGLRWANELSELPYSPLKICQCVFDLGSGCVVAGALRCVQRFWGGRHVAGWVTAERGSGAGEGHDVFWIAVARSAGMSGSVAASLVIISVARQVRCMASIVSAG
jgi:hypothetical protein